jgi:hypothetical protein
MKTLNDLGRACFFEAYRIFQIAYWNNNQKQWESWMDGAIGEVKVFASHDGEVEPNFIYKDVELTWYKNPGRSMQVNKELTPDEWNTWIEDVCEYLYARY